MQNHSAGLYDHQMAISSDIEGYIIEKNRMEIAWS